MKTIITATLAALALSASATMAAGVPGFGGTYTTVEQGTNSTGAFNQVGFLTFSAGSLSGQEVLSSFNSGVPTQCTYTLGGSYTQDGNTLSMHLSETPVLPSATCGMGTSYNTWKGYVAGPNGAVATAVGGALVSMTLDRH